MTWNPYPNPNPNPSPNPNPNPNQVAMTTTWSDTAPSPPPSARHYTESAALVAPQLALLGRWLSRVQRLVVPQLP